MKLYLMQHGNAVSSETNPERPLSQQGQKDIERLAAFLAKGSFQPSRILHSGKLRAQQTAELLAREACPDASIAATDGLKPKDSVETFAGTIASWTVDTAIVGHLPFLGRLVSYLIIDDSEQGVVAYQPGSMICLEKTRGNDWQLAWMMRPELV